MKQRPLRNQLHYKNKALRLSLSVDTIPLFKSGNAVGPNGPEKGVSLERFSVVVMWKK